MTEVLGVAELVGHIGRVVAEAKKFDQTVVTGVAWEAKRALLGATRPKHLSRFADGKGVTLNARFRVRPGREPTATLLPTPPGPWYLLQYGGREHEIGTRTRRSGRRGTRGGSGFLGNAALGFAAMGPVHHPAFRAKHTWTNAATVAVARGSHSFSTKSRQAYVKMFTG